MKIYTGSGDQGKTSLFSGERIFKSDVRVEAYGDVDELNSVLGVFIASLPVSLESLSRELIKIQCDLMDIGAWMATTPGSAAVDMLKPLMPDRVTWIEAAIDRIEAALPPLQGFILPGGHPTSAWAHVARTVCRRAERHALRVSAGASDARVDASAGVMVTYLNRLSDYLFVLARLCNKEQKVPDTLWEAVRAEDGTP